MKLKRKEVMKKQTTKEMIAGTSANASGARTDFEVVMGMTSKPPVFCYKPYHGT
jgi:hypothetical protein